MKKYSWEFPLPRTHTGMLLGNGTLGVMAWGEGGVLRLTFGRADLWDHRGGMTWTPQQSYANLRACLEKADEPGLRALFAENPRPGEPRRPSIIPIGRLDLDFGPEAKLAGGELDLKSGVATVAVERAGRTATVRLIADPVESVLALEIPETLPVEIARVPAWEYVGTHLASISFNPPESFGEAELAGWWQMLPADPGVTVAYRKSGSRLGVAVVRGADAAAARAEARRALDAAGDPAVAEKRAKRWWKEYWRDIPRLELPNPTLSFLYDYGMYKFAILTNPAGVAGTLQGPWIEEYQMPPWSSDYHFNINVQMCYWPAYHGNRLQNLKPLFDLIFSWEAQLRQNAEYFLGGSEGGLMLPHAVDDRCTCMGGFWTGTIDHACTAWVAQMMYLYYRYTLDTDFLRERAWPFMKGAMKVYEGMLEKRGKKYALPVSVSPEYRGAAMNAWGENASFQLAAVHMLLEMLLETAQTLGEKPDPQWKKIQEGLPKVCTVKLGSSEVIGLWKDTPLEESHRHHSHLAAIAPFEIVDPFDPEWRPLIHETLKQWVDRGPGRWTGWCLGWASMLNARAGHAEMAETILELLDRFFTNEGHGTLHDVHRPGLTVMGQGSCSGTTRAEIMQLDAGMGGAAAIMELMLYHSRGVHYLFGGAPRRWRKVGFAKMRTDGAFLVSAKRENGVVEKVKLRSPGGGVFRLANPWRGAARVEREDGAREELADDVLAIETRPGETIELTPADPAAEAAGGQPPAGRPWLYRSRS